MIKSISYSQEEIIQNILTLHCEGKDIDCDPTYSKGNFYKKIPRPLYTFDLVPQDNRTVQADCTHLPLANDSVNVLMFDPPFVISKGPSLAINKKGTNIISSRFSSFGSPKELWDFYTESLKEFYRVIKNGGTLIFKCQDTVSGGKQFLSSYFIIAKAVEIGYYPKDVFILLAKNRLISGKIKKQQHARKFHSYFLVFEKRQSKVDYGNNSKNNSRQQESVWEQADDICPDISQNSTS